MTDGPIGQRTNERTNERTKAESTDRASGLRTLFDRRGSDRVPDGEAHLWHRRVTRTRAISTILIALLGVTAAAIKVRAGNTERSGERTGDRDGAASHFDSTLGALDRRTAVLEQFRGVIEPQVDSLQSDGRMNRYMLCIVVRRMDPTLTPPDCTPIIAGRRR